MTERREDKIPELGPLSPPPPPNNQNLDLVVSLCLSLYFYPLSSVCLPLSHCPLPRPQSNLNATSLPHAVSLSPSLSESAAPRRSGSAGIWPSTDLLLCGAAPRPRVNTERGSLHEQQFVSFPGDAETQRRVCRALYPPLPTPPHSACLAAMSTGGRDTHQIQWMKFSLPRVNATSLKQHSREKALHFIHQSLHSSTTRWRRNLAVKKMKRACSFGFITTSCQFFVSV